MLTPFVAMQTILLTIKNHNRFAYLADVVKYVNTPITAPEAYSVPKVTKPIPKYLEIIYDENDDRRIPVRPYEIPLPPLDEAESVQRNSPTMSVKSCSKSAEHESNTNQTGANQGNCIKGRTISSSSTVSETSVYNVPKKKDLLNVTENGDLSNSSVILTVTLPNPKEDCTSNEKLLLPQQSAYAHDINKRKIQQMYANTNIETAIRSCDGITSM